MIRRPPRSTRTDTRFPYTTLFRSPEGVSAMDEIAAEAPRCPQGDPTPERVEIIRERGIDPNGGITPAKRNTALILAGTAMVLRSEESRVGQDVVSTVRSRMRLGH